MVFVAIGRVELKEALIVSAFAEDAPRVTAPPKIEVEAVVRAEILKDFVVSDKPLTKSVKF